MILAKSDYQLLEALQDGLPLVSRPYQELGKKVGMLEEEVLQRLETLQNDGTIRRMGIVVKHQALGYISNAMVVWDIPDEMEADIGKMFSQFDFVTLCYSRPRRLPKWPYNLFCMIHGKERETVLNQVSLMRKQCHLPEVSYEVLFSRQCFKQQGSHYF